MAAIFAVGAASQLARILMGQYNRLTVINIAAGAVGAGIASVVVVSFLIGSVGLKPDLAIGISGVVGWLGGNVMSALAAKIEQQYGIDITPDTPPAAPVSPPEPVETQAGDAKGKDT